MADETTGIVTGPTILPRSVFWSRDAGRIILGVEALAFQGFPVEVVLGKTLTSKTWSNGFLHDLAGNAYHGKIVAGFTLSVLLEIIWEDGTEATDEQMESPESKPSAVDILRMCNFSG